MLVNYKDNGKKGKDDILPDITEGRYEIQRNKDSMCNLSQKQTEVSSMLESTMQLSEILVMENETG